MIDNQQFANINYYNILLKNRINTIDASNWYQKGGYSNKYVIAGANGLITLSTPLLGGRNQKTLYKDVKIAYTTNWREQHRKSIFSCYGNAPFFSFYKYEIENIFSQEFEFLFDLNFYILQKMIKLLKVEIDFSINSTQKILLEKVFCSKPYFEKNPVIVKIKYPQVFEDRNGFIENLSILDLLFCCGPQAKNLLLSN